MQDTLNRLQRLFRDVLGDERVVLTPTSSAESIEGYDSLAHINIISAVEQEFDVRFELTDLLAIENASDLIALIERGQRRAA